MEFKSDLLIDSDSYNSFYQAPHLEKYKISCKETCICTDFSLKHLTLAISQYLAICLAVSIPFRWSHSWLSILQTIVDRPFAVITYTEAVDRLLKAKKKFEYPVKWGSDLQSEHERYLTEQEFAGTPLFVTDYPKGIKAILSSERRFVCRALASNSRREYYYRGIR